ncbi:MAG TPA: transketolase [Firmicutes bacterium]|nr:transketolase [Bacillota bacterium]
MIARQIRRDAIWMSTKAGCGHLAPALSVADIVAVLYGGIMRHDPKNPAWPQRDRFILSKGHGCLALYSVLSQMGYFDRRLLGGFCSEYGTMLAGHPERSLPGVEANTGSLGHGIALGLGMALGARLDGLDYLVFVLVGDGELEEGSNWEAAMAAARHEAGNLVVIVDRNGLQLGGFTEKISRLEPLDQKWQAFGWNVKTVNGHDIPELMATIASVRHAQAQPTVVIAHTVKGKGLEIAENKVEWHYKALTREQYNALDPEVRLEVL